MFTKLIAQKPLRIVTGVGLALVIMHLYVWPSLFIVLLEAFF